MDSTTPSSFGPPPPPPFQSPPPIITPPPGTRSPRRWGWIIISIVLFVLLGISVLMNVGSFFSGMAGMSSRHHRYAGPRLDEVVVSEHRGREKVAVVPVEGIIYGGRADRGGYTMVEVIKAQMDRAAESDDVKAVILRVDSPGGEVLASDEIARYISKFQDESGKPVVVCMGSLAASGGYYVSAPCDWIVANELTITGSIGVIMHGWNYRGLMNKVGLKPVVYKSGKFKDMLSGDREEEQISPEERAMVQRFIDETYAKFKQVVLDGRNDARDDNPNVKPLVADWSDYADGRILSGKEALEIGLVDQLGDFEDAVAQAEKLGGVMGSATVVEYRQRVDLADIFGLWGQSESRTVKVDLGIETPQLEAGRAYFIAPTYLH